MALIQGAIQAQQRLQEREVRSFEVDPVNALWHLDFHHSSIKLARANGQWQTPKLLGIIVIVRACFAIYSGTG